jgi:nucleotide-binding universal stress UspA family protein
VTGQVRDVSTRVTTGEPSQALLRLADGNDLLVIGKRRGSPWSTSVLGSTAVAVAARCNGPVVVVPEAWTVAGHRSRHLVAGIDGQSDAGALDVAFDRAQTIGVALVVVHAWNGPEPHSVSADEDAHLREEIGQRLAEAVAPWVQEYPEVDVSLECHSLTPVVSLLGVASDAQLLVVGRDSRPRYSGDLGTGSTVRKVLHHASCPVMVVPRASGDAESHRLGLLEELPGYSTSWQ